MKTTYIKRVTQFFAEKKRGKVMKTVILPFCLIAAILVPLLLMPPAFTDTDLSDLATFQTDFTINGSPPGGGSFQYNTTYGFEIIFSAPIDTGNEMLKPKYHVGGGDDGWLTYTLPDSLLIISGMAGPIFRGDTALEIGEYEINVGLPGFPSVIRIKFRNDINIDEGESPLGTDILDQVYSNLWFSVWYEAEFVKRGNGNSSYIFGTGTITVDVEDDSTPAPTPTPTATPGPGTFTITKDHNGYGGSEASKYQVDRQVLGYRVVVSATNGSRTVTHVVDTLQTSGGATATSLTDLYQTLPITDLVDIIKVHVGGTQSGSGWNITGGVDLSPSDYTLQWRDASQGQFEIVFSPNVTVTDGQSLYIYFDFKLTKILPLLKISGNSQMNEDPPADYSAFNYRVGWTNRAIAYSTAGYSNTAVDTASYISERYLRKRGVVENGYITWTITIGNGYTSLKGATVTDVLGAGTAFVDDSSISVKLWNQHYAVYPPPTPPLFYDSEDDTANINFITNNIVINGTTGFTVNFPSSDINGNDIYLAQIIYKVKITSTSMLDEKLTNTLTITHWGRTETMPPFVIDVIRVVPSLKKTAKTTFDDPVDGNYVDWEVNFNVPGGLFGLPVWFEDQYPGTSGSSQDLNLAREDFIITCSDPGFTPRWLPDDPLQNMTLVTYGKYWFLFFGVHNEVTSINGRADSQRALYEDSKSPFTADTTFTVKYRTSLDVVPGSSYYEEQYGTLANYLKTTPTNYNSFYTIQNTAYLQYMLTNTITVDSYGSITNKLVKYDTAYAYYPVHKKYSIRGDLIQYVVYMPAPYVSSLAPGDTMFLDDFDGDVLEYVDKSFSMQVWSRLPENAPDGPFGTYTYGFYERNSEYPAASNCYDTFANNITTSGGRSVIEFDFWSMKRYAASMGMGGIHSFSNIPSHGVWDPIYEISPILDVSNNYSSSIHNVVFVYSLRIKEGLDIKPYTVVNTATMGGHSGTTEAVIGGEALTKTMWGTGGGAASVEIIFNPSYQRIGTPVYKAVDTMGPGLAYIPDTLQFWTLNNNSVQTWEVVSTTAPAANSSGGTAWTYWINDPQHLDFWFPDGKAVKITYRVRGIPNAEPDYSNKIEVLAHFKECELEGFEVSSSLGKGDLTVDSLLVIKQDADTGAYLNGVNFGLYIAGRTYTSGASQATSNGYPASFNLGGTVTNNGGNTAVPVGTVVDGTFSTTGMTISGGTTFYFVDNKATVDGFLTFRRELYPQGANIIYALYEKECLPEYNSPKLTDPLKDHLQLFYFQYPTTAGWKQSFLDMGYDFYDSYGDVLVENQNFGFEFRKVKLSSKTEDLDPLPGAIFGVFETQQAAMDYAMNVSDGIIVTEPGVVPSGSGAIVTATSGPDGTVTFTGLCPGNFFLAELVPPDGYGLSWNVYSLEIFNDGTFEIDYPDSMDGDVYLIGNYPLRIGIMKTYEWEYPNEDNEALFQGTSFELIDKDNPSKIYPFETNGDGFFTLEDIPYGTYYLYEICPKEWMPTSFFSVDDWVLVASHPGDPAGSARYMFYQELEAELTGNGISKYGKKFGMVDNVPSAVTGEIVIEGEKTVQIMKNAPGAPEEFFFTLTRVDNAAGDEYTGEDPIFRQASRVGAGPFEFPIIQDLAPGVHWFKIEELEGDTPGWKYDTAPRIVKVTVDSEGVATMGSGVGTGGISTGEEQRISIEPTNNLHPTSNQYIYANLSWEIYWGHGANWFYSMRNSDNSTAVGALYCLERDSSVGPNPQYAPVTNLATMQDFDLRFSPYANQMLWLARNGFSSTGAVTSRAIDPERQADNSSYPYVYTFAGTNNLADVQALPGVPAGLKADEAYAATQLALWHFAGSIGFSGGVPNHPMFNISPTTSSRRIRDTYYALLDLATDAVDNGEVITQLSLSVSFDTGSAQLADGWYGPVKVRVNPIPVDFTSKANIPIAITPASGVTVSKTKGGAAYSGDFFDDGVNDTFWLEVSSLGDPETELLAEATASVAPASVIKDSYVFQYSNNWNAGQPCAGIGALPRNLDLTATANLYYGSEGCDNITFNNKFVKAGVTITGDKEVKGTPESPEEFFFILMRVANAAADPYLGPDAIFRQTSRVGAGPIEFPIIEDLVPGIYWFLAEEIDNETEGWVYDTDPRIIKVVVDDNGNVTVSTGGSYSTGEIGSSTGGSQTIDYEAEHVISGGEAFASNSAGNFRWRYGNGNFSDDDGAGGRNLGVLYSYRYDTGEVLIGASYCIDLDVHVSSGNRYKPLLNHEDMIGQYGANYNQMLWLARNGFMSKTKAQQYNDSGPANVGTYASFGFKDGTNNLAELIDKLLPYVSNSTDRDNLIYLATEPISYAPGGAPLNGVIAYAATQLAMWSYSGGTQIWGPFNFYTFIDQFPEYMKPLHNALRAAANDAVANDEIIKELTLGVNFDTSDASQQGTWYGPVRINIELDPVGFTQRSYAEVTLLSDYPLAADTDGTPLASTLRHGNEFYVETGGISPGTTELAAGIATLGLAPIKDVYVITQGGSSSAWSSTQAIMGVGTVERDPSLSAVCQLFYNTGGGELTFINKYKVSTDVTIEGKKMVEGPEAEEQDFTFRLTQVENEDGDELIGDPAIDPNPMETTVPTNGEGEYSFSFSFNLPDGTYFFLIEEIDDKAPGWKYDDNAYIVKVVVSSGTFRVIGGGGGGNKGQTIVADIRPDPPFEYTLPGGVFDYAEYTQGYFTFLIENGGKTYVAQCADSKKPGPLPGQHYELIERWDTLSDSKKRLVLISALATSLGTPNYGAKITHDEFANLFGLGSGWYGYALMEPYIDAAKKYARTKSMQHIVWACEAALQMSDDGVDAVDLLDVEGWTDLPDWPYPYGDPLFMWYAQYYIIDDGGLGMYQTILPILMDMVDAYLSTPADESISTFELSLDPDTGRLTFDRQGYSTRNGPMKLTWSGDTTGLTVKKGTADIPSGTIITDADEIYVEYTGEGEVTFTLTDSIPYLVGGSISSDYLKNVEMPTARQHILVGQSKLVLLKNCLTIGGDSEPGGLTFINKYKVPSVLIEGNKNVEGMGADEQDFTFTLTQVENAQGDDLESDPVIDPNPLTVTIPTNGEDDYPFSFEFDLPKVDAEYFFLLKETDESVAFWHYDQTEFIIRVVVSGGVATVYYPGGQEEESITISNETGTANIVPDHDIQVSGNEAGPLAYQWEGAPSAAAWTGLYWGYYNDQGVGDIYWPMHFRYMQRSAGNTNVLVGALYCLDKDNDVLNTERPNLSQESFMTRFDPYGNEILWLARNGFASTGKARAGVLAPERNFTATQFPNVSGGVGRGYKWTFEGVNNLAEVRAITGVPGLEEDEAYGATQLAIWHFTEVNFNPQFPTTGSNVNRYYTNDSVERIGAAYHALIAKASTAAAGDMIAELALAVTFDTSTADTDSGSWYGPVTLKTTMWPANFTTDNFVPITLSGIAPGVVVSRTAGGAPYTGPYYNGEEFFVQLGSSVGTEPITLIKATATLSSSARIKDAYVFWANTQQNWTAHQPTIGIGAMPRDITLEATADLRYNVTGNGPNFRNKYNPGGVRLPNSGGSGAARFILSGLALIVIVGAFYVVVTIRNRRRMFY